jgi:hypothetical protein
MLKTKNKNDIIKKESKREGMQMKKYIIIIFSLLLFCLSSCKPKAITENAFFEELQQTTAKLQEGTLSFSWEIKENSNTFRYSYWINTSDNQRQITIANDAKDKTKYYFYQYKLENNKLMKTHKYYHDNDLQNDYDEVADQNIDDFNKLRVIEFHNLNFKSADVETYTSHVESGMPARFYSEILFKEDFSYLNQNDFFSLDLCNVRLLYTRDSTRKFEIFGKDSKNQEIKIIVII